MRLPSLKKIMREDLKEAPQWINPLIDVLNNFMETCYQALNRNITFSENIGCFIKEISYQTPSTYPTMEPVKIPNTLKTKAIGLQVLQVLDSATYLPALGSVYAPWVEINGQIYIYPIPGLVASKTYMVRVLVT